MDNIFNFTARWADCDMNGHMRHSAYYDYAAHARVSFFTDNKLPLDELKRMGFGPVLLREECKFMRELLLNQACRIELLASGESKDLRFFQAQHIFTRDDKHIAVLTADIAWIDLSTRRIAKPPATIIETMNQIPKTQDFIELRPQT